MKPAFLMYTTEKDQFFSKLPVPTYAELYIRNDLMSANMLMTTKYSYSKR